jgi:hypothetical protein
VKAIAIRTALGPAASLRPGNACIDDRAGAENLAPTRKGSTMAIVKGTEFFDILDAQDGVTNNNDLVLGWIRRSSRARSASATFRPANW